MKTVFQVALGIILAGLTLFAGKLLFWGWFLSSLNTELEKSTKRQTTAIAATARPQYRTTTETIKPKSLRECQAIYGNQIDETTRTCMEGSILTVRINSKTGDREVLRREKYYHLEKQNVL